MIIRKAAERDIPRLLEIYNYEVINGVSTLDLNPRTLEEWQEWFSLHQTAEHPLLVAETDGIVAGYATLSPYRQKEAYRTTAELSVYIAPEFRRQGVASALMAEILRLARENGSLHLIVSVITSGNAASGALHRKFGFSYCGTIHEVGFKHGEYRSIDNYELIL
ncbi:MAG: GNAT family N-acetyltransferase [Huintestinicola sp.]|uniref:GNAT family N-acetyltransferase n=1 Tax=Huintestinicola sp. TaxID=2981661 RepID=UPI003F0CE5B9